MRMTTGAARRTARMSVSLSEAQMTAIEEIAQQNGVSVGWVIRYACTEFLQRCSGGTARLSLTMRDEDAAANSRRPRAR
jgi:hypothetical protein